MNLLQSVIKCSNFNKFILDPSDLLFLEGKYSAGEDLPRTPGFEGSGTVVASGGGIMGWSIKGKRVAVAT